VLSTLTVPESLYPVNREFPDSGGVFQNGRTDECRTGLENMGQSIAVRPGIITAPDMSDPHIGLYESAGLIYSMGILIKSRRIGIMSRNCPCGKG
jgi:hypothetical protein